MCSATRGARTLLAMAGVTVTSILSAQQPPATPPVQPVPAETDDELVVLSPFEVSGSATVGYAAATTLAGNRLNTELRDIGSSVSVVTSEFLRDTGATDNKTLLQYTPGTEVGGTYGNFGGNGDGRTPDESGKFVSPNTNTRVRGLATADNTRDFFMTSIPWEGYNVDAVDLQRGPNSILFGMGSPAGIINERTKQAGYKNSGEVTFRVGSYGSNRATLDVNRVLIKDQLAIRIDVLRNDEEYKEKPAYSKDERFYGAIRYEPGFLKHNGARTIIKANYEAGRVRSNNPRSMPPIDLITPWFYTGTYQGKDSKGNPVTYNNLNRETFIPAQLTDDNTGTPNHGQIRPSINGGPDAGKANPAYNPWVGNFAQQFGGPLVYFNGDSSASTGSRVLEVGGLKGGLAANGTIDNTVGGIPWMRPGGVATYASYATNARLPLYNYGVYKDRYLTDSSVFDYYNKLIDGPNKKESQNFHVYNISLAETFLDDQLGFELAYNKELYKNSRLSLLTGANQAIYIDINRVYTDGTPVGLNGQPFGDGTPNPNVGRAFISDNGQGNNGSSMNDREVKRLTVFATHDFEKDSKNLITKIVGKHTVTGLFASELNSTENRSWIRYTADDATLARRDVGNHEITDNWSVPNTVIYLGDSLLNRTSASGANLPNPTAAQVVVPNKVWDFNATWNKSTDPTSANYVDPNAVWINAYYPDTPAFNDPTAANHARISTQSENPANYVGWQQQPVNWIDSEASAAGRAHNTTSIALGRRLTSSNAFVWQSHFWNNSIVGTYGARKDVTRYTAASISADTVYGGDPAGRGVIPASRYPHLKVGDTYDTRDQVTSHSWMVVAHLNDLPGIDQLVKKSPVSVSLFYNYSTNFQPEASRNDMYNSPLSSPTGKTTERGLLLETKDGKYSLKVTKYESSSVNVTNTNLAGSWFIGASQTWGGNWANHFQYDWTGDTYLNAVAAPDPNNSQYNYGLAPGETLAQAQAREQAAIAGWRAWQDQLKATPYYTAWKLDLTTPFRTGNPSGLNTTQPNNLAFTEDTISRGYEFELQGQITQNWRLTANAARTTAERNNVGGAALTDFVTRYETALNTTAAGDLRIWWGGAGNETTKYQWDNNIGSSYHMLKLLEHTNTPELRKWRFNLVNNYDFSSGFLKGVNVGGGVRYESSIVIGYPVVNTGGPTVFYDIQHPYHGKGETNFDFWVGYTRKVWRNLEWNIQINVRNAFVGDELVPINTQPDGSVAAYRIRPPQTWQVTNSFRF